jgi:hypothetical protein
MKSFILDDRGITIAGTMGCIPINFKAYLPAGLQTIDLDIIDTLGEIWRKSWQDGNDKRWQETLNRPTLKTKPTTFCLWTRFWL